MYWILALEKGSCIYYKLIFGQFGAFFSLFLTYINTFIFFMVLTQKPYISRQDH